MSTDYSGALCSCTVRSVGHLCFESTQSPIAFSVPNCCQFNKTPHQKQKKGKQNTKNQGMIIIVHSENHYIPNRQSCEEGQTRVLGDELEQV